MDSWYPFPSPSRASWIKISYANALHLSFFLVPIIVVHAHLIHFLISSGSSDLKDSTNPSLNNLKKTTQTNSWEKMIRECLADSGGWRKTYLQLTVWSVCDGNTTRMAKAQTKVTLTFLVAIWWFQVKGMQQWKTKKWGRKTVELVTASHYEAQALKSHGFGTRLNADSKASSLLQGFAAVSAYLPCCSKTALALLIRERN